MRQRKMSVKTPNLGGSKIQKRSVKIAGHYTSVSIEGVFWDALKKIANSRTSSINSLIEQIDSIRSKNSGNNTSNLSSAIRVFILNNKIP